MKTKMIIKNQKGAAVVEFALVAPLLLVLFFGIIEGGLALYNKAIITNACREAARNTIVLRNPRPPSGDRDTIVENTITYYITSRIITFGQSGIPGVPGGWTRVTVPPGHVYDFIQDITIDAETANIGDPGDSLRVRVRFYYSFLAFPNLVALMRGSYSKTVTINAETIMRFE